MTANIIPRNKCSDMEYRHMAYEHLKPPTTGRAALLNGSTAADGHAFSAYSRVCLQALFSTKHQRYVIQSRSTNFAKRITVREVGFKTCPVAVIFTGQAVWFSCSHVTFGTDGFQSRLPTF